jgi:predicted nucleotidyltransferase
MQRPPAEEVAHRFVTERFPDAIAAFLGGSVIAGDATATSDLDIMVVTAHEGAPFRESFVEGG